MPVVPAGAAVAVTDTVAPARQQRDRQLAAWLQHAAAGDAKAFEQFYDATAPVAQGFARRLLHEADVDDVLAEVYFQAWREAPRFDALRGSAMTWLLTRVHSRSMDLRRQQKHAPLAGQADHDAMAQLPAELPGPEDVLALAEAGSRLHRALAALSAQERWVLGLAYFRELSHAATAELTGLPLGTVKSLLLRSQQKLRALMGSSAAMHAGDGTAATNP